MKARFSQNFQAAFLGGMDFKFHTEGKEHLEDFYTTFQGKCQETFFVSYLL